VRRDDPAQRATRPELPSDDLPSAEVLDELLRAFSADSADEQTLAEVDLASPEVAELLAPTSPTPAPDRPVDASAEPAPAADPPAAEPPMAEPRPVVEADPAAEVEAEAAVEVDVEVEAASEVVPPAPGTADATPAPDAAAVEEPADEVATVDVPEPAPATEAVGDTAGSVEAPAAPEVDAPPDETSPSSAATRTIVIDASEEQPDAVYLAAGDPLLAASAGGRGLAAGRAPVVEPAADAAPVFIDDAAVEAGETITIADASTATRIEPRLRERRIAVRRAAGRKRLRWAFLGAVVLVVVVAALAVLGSSLFAVEDVTVDGAVNTDATRLQAVVDELEGTPVLRADTDRAERELEAIPWVADARVSTQFPHGATIELRERTPEATYQGPDGRFRVIDIDGRVLDVVDGQPSELLPITSADIADLEPGQFAAQGFIAAANLVQSLTPELRAASTAVAVTGNGSDLRLVLTEGREARFGPGRDLVVKLVRLQTRLDQLADAGFQYVDVSTDDVTTG